jgi:hypothetical protein
MMISPSPAPVRAGGAPRAARRFGIMADTSANGVLPYVLTGWKAEGSNNGEKSAQKAPAQEQVRAWAEWENLMRKEL